MNALEDWEVVLPSDAETGNRGAEGEVFAAFAFLCGKGIRTAIRETSRRLRDFVGARVCDQLCSAEDLL